MNSRFFSPKSIFGVDFSGAAKPANRIWISQGIIRRGNLYFQGCFPLSHLVGSSADRERCYQALRGLAVRYPESAWGLDFPFSLPVKCISESDWTTFVRNFARRFPSPEHFRQFCRQVQGQRELKRATDTISRAPFSPYNLRVYRQTYFGIRELLAPLLNAESIRVLPMQHPAAGKAWFLEVCPASSLKKLGIYRPYKGRRKQQRERRQAIFDFLLKSFPIATQIYELKEIVAENAGGDALDSLLGALIVFQVFKHPRELFPQALEAISIEGHVYF